MADGIGRQQGVDVSHVESHPRWASSLSGEQTMKKEKPPSVDHVLLAACLVVVVVSLQAHVLVQLALAGALTVLVSVYNRRT
jgi:hypothetical protein